MKPENKFKLPKIGAKRFGHRSHIKRGTSYRNLDKGGYFDDMLTKEREKYVG